MLNKKYKIFGTIGQEIPHNAVEQMNMAMDIEPAVKGALMPDAHHGYSVPIGGVVALDNAISPAYIGYDISCMLMMSVFDIPVSEFLEKRKDMARSLREETRFGLGARFEEDELRDHEVMSDSRWEDTKLLRGFKDNAQQQLGTSGAGNHFADLMVGEWIGIAQDGMVALVTHSGSRGTGHRIAGHYMKLADSLTPGCAKGYGWLVYDSAEGQEYRTAMELMGAYSFANHELIHSAFTKRAGLEVAHRHYNRHNFAWESDGLIVHRKGATPAGQGEFGIIPGSSGSHSYLTVGMGNQDSLESSSHGAGRVHSRSKAKKLHNDRQFLEHMADWDILHYGVANDETKYAYKDIEEVLGIQDGVLLRRIARMTPKVVIMGGAGRSRG